MDQKKTSKSKNMSSSQIASSSLLKSKNCNIDSLDNKQNNSIIENDILTSKNEKKTIIDKNTKKSDSSKTKKKKNRCSVCNTKLGLMVFHCKCSDSVMFCVHHMFPEAHQCTYDHKSDKKNKLSQQLVKVVSDKVVRI